MGLYINPTDCTKEEWLAKNGEAIDVMIYGDSLQEQRAGIEYELSEQDEEYVPVCLVDNGAFTAAGICTNTRELSAFLREDGRPKLWFLVPVQALVAVQPLVAEL